MTSDLTDVESIPGSVCRALLDCFTVSALVIPCGAPDRLNGVALTLIQLLSSEVRLFRHRAESPALLWRFHGAGCGVQHDPRLAFGRSDA
jgi:hypothetical protein